MRKGQSSKILVVSANIIRAWNSESKPDRTRIEQLSAVGYELSEEHLPVPESRAQKPKHSP